MSKLALKYILLSYFIITYAGCKSPFSDIIKEYTITLHNYNELKIQIDVVTNEKVEVSIQYWMNTDSANKIQTIFSKKGLKHSLILYNLIAKTNYSFHFVTYKDGVKKVSKTYSFHSNELPIPLQNQFKRICEKPDLLPREFKNGLILLNKGEIKGGIYIVDCNGQLRWYEMFEKNGVKVSHFTNDTTIIAILGEYDDPTSYGSEIIEFNLTGDTLLHLVKGQVDFTHTIHHEIIMKSKDEIVTLYVDKRIFDLRSIGGNKTDTVKGDGIIILDRNGKRKWQWSVFDVTDPLKDINILKTKNDWVHANSLNFSKDSNFIISFYNTGQIWKIDSHTGKVIWKFGKGGNIVKPKECNFSESHAAHINNNGELMFFDNGVKNQRSQIFSLKLNEFKSSSKIGINIKLPFELFNDRMGSAYMVGDSAILSCSSKKDAIVLLNFKGKILWRLDTKIKPYRAEFLRQESLRPYLK